MYGLSLGVQHMNEILPAPVYALLSGLNASTVGIIALAAVQLAEKAIRDKLSRIQVILGACAGLCYNALWYFPLLLVLGGLATVIWDGWMSQKIGKLRVALKRRRRNPHGVAEEASLDNSVALGAGIEGQGIVQRRNVATGSMRSNTPVDALPQSSVSNAGLQSAGVEDSTHHTIRIKIGIAIVVLFFGMSYLVTLDYGLS